MADDPTPQRPPEPASDAKKHAIKRVVLSSVAKPPEPGADSLLGEPDPAKSSTPSAKTDDGLIRPVGWTTRPGGTTTIIKLPPKTGVLPRLTSLGQKKEPPPLPGQPETAKGDEETKLLPPIKISTPSVEPANAQESIFPSAGAPSIEVKPPPARKAVPPPLPPRSDKKSPIAPQAPISPLRKTVQLKRAPEPAVQGQRLADPHRVAHVPPLVAADAPTREAEAEAKASTAKGDPNAQTSRLVPPPAIAKPEREIPSQTLLPIPEAAKTKPPQIGQIERATKKHRLPPRVDVAGRLPDQAAAPEKPVSRLTGPVSTPPKVYPITPPSTPIKPEEAPAGPLAPAAVKAQKASVTPPTIPLKPGTGTVKPPTIPLKGAPMLVPYARTGSPAVADKEEDLDLVVPNSRAERKRKRRLYGIIFFYVVLVALIPGLYFGSLAVTQETRVEGQIIPPPDMQLANEAWIVTDFRTLATGVASDLGDQRQITLQDMQEKVGHVQRAQADVGSRESRIRLLKDQIQANNDEEMSLVKQARAAAQQVWDGPGAALESDYQSRLDTLNHAIADRAKANRLKYEPDPNYYSPEVWANAYRLALYQVPPGVDAVKERAWLDGQMKAWHAFTKAMDQKQNELRAQATQLKLAPASKVADLKQQVGDLQQRIDSTIAEEEPLKAELEQAQADLKVVQEKEAALDARYYPQLDALPEANITKRLTVRSNGRFSWPQKDFKYVEGETMKVFWIFTRAYRADGRQYWALNRLEVPKNRTAVVSIEPSNFVSTRAILRPDLSPDEQAR